MFYIALWLKKKHFFFARLRKKFHSMAALPYLSPELWQNISDHVSDLPLIVPVITCVYFVDHWGMIDGTNKEEMEDSNALAIHVSKAVSREEYLILKSSITCPEHGMKKRWINGNEEWIEFTDAATKPIYPEFRLSFALNDMSHVCGKFIVKALAMGWNFASIKDQKSFETREATFRLTKPNPTPNSLMRTLPPPSIKIKPIIYFNYQVIDRVSWSGYPKARMQMFFSKTIHRSEFEILHFKGHRHYDTIEDLQDLPTLANHEPVEPESELFYPVYAINEYSPLEKDIVDEQMALAFAFGWNYASAADHESHMSGLRSFLLSRDQTT